MNSKLAILALITAFSTGSCSWEYPGGTIETYPSVRNSLLSPGEAVSVTLPRSADLNSAERLFKISSPEGICGGSISRSGETLTFRPEEDYAPGERYLLTFKGDLILKSGGITPVFIELPFFYLEGYKDRLRVTGISPSPGSFISRDEQFTISLSHKIDAAKLESALSFNPENNTDAVEVLPPVDSAAEGQEYRITPKNPFADSAAVELIISSELEAETSLPMAGEYRASFHVQSAQIPAVLNLFCAENDPASNFPNLFPLDDESPDVGPGSVFRILFSTEMNSQSVEAAFKTEPFIAGGFLNTGAEEMVFIPDRELDPGGFQLKLETSAESSEGVRLSSAFSRSFHAAVNHTLTEIGGKPADGFPIGPDFDTSAILEITPALLSGDYTFTFLYSGPVPDTDTRLRLQESVRIISIFPPFNTDPQPIGASWVGERVSTGFTGFKVSDDEHDYYYRLEVCVDDRDSGGQAIEFFIKTAE